MDVWVRTQIKTGLRKISDLNYRFPSIMAANRNSPPKHYVYDGDTLLGTYATEERCLEIIDEIQELLKQGCIENAFLKFTGVENYGDIDLNYVNEITRTKKCAFLSNNCDVEIIQPNVIVYEMPQE